LPRAILGVTGSVAAIRSLDVAAALEQRGFETRLAVTRHALYFLDPVALQSYPTQGRALIRDEDEWHNSHYTRNDPVLHIELRRWADAFVVAPLDANTLAKFALGISDNLLTCLYRAWDFNKPLILAPAMNTFMWDSPITLRHLKQILADRASIPPPENWTLSQAGEIFAACARNVVLVPTQIKTLACGDTGDGAMADPAEIAAHTAAALSP